MADATAAAAFMTIALAIAGALFAESAFVNAGVTEPLAIASAILDFFDNAA